MNIKHAQRVLAHLEATRSASIERLADDAPVPRPESWAGREAPRMANALQREHILVDPELMAIPSFARRYIDDTPTMLRVHAAIEAEARATAAAAIKMRAHLYALHPRELDAIVAGLSYLPPRRMVQHLVNTSRFRPERWLGTGGKIPAIAMRGAMLYARYLRAKENQVARLRHNRA